MQPREPMTAWRAAVVLGLLVALAAGAVIALAYLRGDHHPEVGSDSALFANVAADPFGNGHTIIAPVVNGPSYRYGRVLFPLLAWALALGRPSLLGWTLAIVFALSMGLAVGEAAWLVRQRGRAPWYGLAILASPFVVLWLVGPAVVAEPTVVALVLLAYVLHEKRRPGAVRITAAGVLLARETAVLAFAPLVWRAWRRAGWRGLLAWSWVPLPYLAWATWVRFRVGEFPFADPAYSRRAAISLPFLGIRDVFDGSFRNAEQLTLLVGLATIVLAAFVWRERRWFPISGAAAATAAIVPFLGINVWSYLFEASRVLYLPQVLAVLALVAGGSRPGPDARRARDLDLVP